MKDPHFNQIFWFVVFLCGFSALLTAGIIFLPVPKANERFADQALVFWLTSGAGTGIGFLVGSSLGKSRNTTNQQADTVINNTTKEAEPEV